MPSAARVELRVVTFNVLGCRGFPRQPGAVAISHEPSERILEALAARVAGWQADVVVLQEAPPKNAVRRIARQTGMHMAYFPGRIAGGPEFPAGFPGAVLSRHPLVDATDRASGVFATDDPRFQRHWGTVGIRVGGRVLRLSATHLCSDWNGADGETTRLAELETLLDSPPGDLIAADANTSPGSPAWRRLRDAGWRDGWVEGKGRGAGFTWDSRTPHRRIDYLWLAPGSHWHAVAAKVDRAGMRVGGDGPELLFSDHFPLIVDLIHPADQSASPTKRD